MEVTVYIALGSNIEPREAYLNTALDLLAQKVNIEAVSGWYKTKPFGIENQGGFINLAAKITTDLSPADLFACVKEIEKKTGRIERERWFEREIDIDILLYGDTIIETENLKIPHPGLRERDFFLIPLLEISPDLIYPGLGVPLASFVSPLLPVYIQSTFNPLEDTAIE